jgi:hypothetical protein
MLKRINLFVKYLKNSRIVEYQDILSYAISNNYQLISLRDFAEKNYDENMKLMILRHDVDHKSKGTQLMFNVEQKLKANSSFYFRNSTIDYELANKIEDNKSEASLHFETLAYYVRKNKIKTKTELFTNDFKKECLSNLKDNINKYRKHGLACRTIASHGEYENRLVKTPNNYLTEDLGSYQELGILLEAYNPNLISKIDCYISDTVIEINNGYRYGVSPIEAVDECHNIILFLSHPNHWHYSFFKKIKKLVKILLLGPVFTKDSFKRI